MDQEELVRAIASYNNAITIKPDYSKALNNLGSALQKNGKFVEAVAAFEKHWRLIQPTLQRIITRHSVARQWAL